jgi:hypothetical protein
MREVAGRERVIRSTGWPCASRRRRDQASLAAFRAPRPLLGQPWYALKWLPALLRAALARAVSAIGCNGVFCKSCESRPSWGMRSHHSLIALAPLDRQQVGNMVGALAARHALPRRS